MVQHGLIATVRDDTLLHRLVDAGARVISIARPGYGESAPYPLAHVGEWGDMTAVLVNELGLAEFDVLGMSSGAPYSYAVGHTLADRVRNIYVLSGTPALYDARVRELWPYRLNQNATRAEMQQVAFELFFAQLSEQERARQDIQDSMRHDCFGIALDLTIRVKDWGFTLNEVPAKSYLRHSTLDPAVPVVTAERTAEILPHGELLKNESDVHFSPVLLDEFIDTIIVPRLP